MIERLCAATYNTGMFFWILYNSQTVEGVAVGETRDDSKLFEYDHSFWSVETQDLHFVNQEQVHL